MAKKSVKFIVESILTNNFASKDCDLILYERVINSLGHDLSKITAMKLLTLTLKKEIPSFDTVSRTRRNVQEYNQPLRGLNWSKRQMHSKKVRKKIEVITEKKF